MDDRWFGHSGDLGDIIYSLPTIRAVGGGTLYLYHTPGKTSHGMTVEKAESLRSLLMLQPYIKDVVWCPDGHEDHNLNGFRDHYRGLRNLADCHLATHGLGPEHRERAWLQVDAPVTDFPVVLHRSQRYHNNAFPWRAVVEKYRGKAVMVGFTAEWELFCREFGHVPYVHTANLLEVARIIAGCRLFVGNQSSPEAICEGLKQNKILEVSTQVPNSCMFKRLGAVYAVDSWRLELPDI
jgi:hypothetical protein